MSTRVPISRNGKPQSSPDGKMQIKPGLYIVATPIGNLRDITLRALDILQAADIILAEDTRHSSKLLQAYDVKARLVSYHDHNVAGRLPEVMDWLEEGKTIAQISDAGTPLISDPGYKLVRAARDAGHDVFPVPGASSVMAALMGAGLPTDRFTFIGFLPPKIAARQKALAELSVMKTTLVFFETGPRIRAVLEDIRAVLGDRTAVIARELTKTYEEFLEGSVTDLATQVEQTPLKGEIVLLVAPGSGTEKWSNEKIDAALKENIPDMGTKRASNFIAEQSGWSKRDVYVRAQALK